MKNFNCTCCGECCSGDIDIYINHYDLYKIAKHLQMESTKELFDKKFVELKEGQNRILLPKLRFKTSPYKFCPFLVNDLDENNILKSYCSLHPLAKPLVCALAPVSKEYDTDTGKTRYFYTRLTESCPGTFDIDDTEDREITAPVLKEIEYEEMFFRILDRIIKSVTTDYSDELYYFPVSDEYDDIITNTPLFRQDSDSKD